MKKILLVILFLLLFPTIVLAKDTCNGNDIKIEEISIEEKEGYTEELTPISIYNNKINLNIEMYNVGESITYKIKVKNNSNNDYYFTKNSFNLNTDYIEYSLLNDSAVIKANEEKEITLKITYKEKIPEDEFNENNMMSITLSDTPLSNPSTKRSLILIFLVISITLVVIFLNKNKKQNKVLIGILICSIPLSIKALCTINLEINANITINEKEAIFLPGKEVNVKMKELAGDDTSTSTTEPHFFSDENIIDIKYSSQEPSESNKEDKNTVSTIDSPYPIYMWYEEGIIYWWSEAHHPELNQDASHMFNNLTKLSNLDGINKFDAATAIDMQYMFYGAKSITKLQPIKNWDVLNVTNMTSLFSYTTSLTTLEDLTSWNTSSVTNMNMMFYSTALNNLHGLENWDTSSVTDMSMMFQNATNLQSIVALEKWNTSRVTSLFQTFLSTSLNDLSGLENWNISNVTSLRSTFSSIENLTSIEMLKNWNTSNITNMSGTFSKTSLKSLNGLENWDVSKVENFYMTFHSIYSLTDASAINNWDIQKSAIFSSMFYKTPTHPKFAKVPGTWNLSGTFIPTP